MKKISLLSCVKSFRKPLFYYNFKKSNKDFYKFFLFLVCFFFVCKIDRCIISYTNNLEPVYMLNEYIVCTQIKAFSTFLHVSNVIFSLFLQWECHGIFHLIYVYDCNRIVIHARPPFFQTLFYIGFFRKSLTTQTTWPTNRDRGQRIQNIEYRIQRVDF